MAKLRLISDNAVDRATVTGSTNTQPASNLKTGSKSDVWRTSQLNGSINLLWSAPESISCVSLPFTNTSATATARLRVTSEASSSNLIAFSDNIILWTTNGDTGSIGSYGRGPDGLSTTTYIANGTRYRTTAVTVGTTYTYSYFVKAITGTGALLYIDGVTPTLTATFTFATKAFTSVSSGVTTTYTEYPNGWFRIALTFTSTGSSINTHAYPSGGSIEATCAMLEVGALSSYYPSLNTLSSRSSTGTYIDVNGLIATAAVDTARMQYQYPSLATVAPRMLVESAATNLLLYSELISNAAWTKGASTVGTSITSPDGASTALRLLDTTSNAPHYIQQVISLTTATNYTFSAFVKAGNLSKVQLTNGSLGAFANFDTLEGTIISSGGTGYVASAIQAFPNGWFRVSVTFLSAATSSQSMILSLLDASGNSTYVGTGSGMWVWGLQTESGRLSTSYIPTTTATVTRSADVLNTSGINTRPLGYMDWWQKYTYDSGTVVVNSSEAIKVPGLTSTQAASAYSYNSGRTFTMYCTSTSAYGVRVDIVDTSNLQGYIEAPFIVAGDYFSPTYNAEIGATISMEDLSKSYRSDAGNLKKDVSAKYKKINLDLSVVTEANRTPLWKLVSYAGTSNPVWMSVYPVDTNPDKEQAYTIYGYFTKATEIAAKSSNIYSTKFELEGL